MAKLEYFIVCEGVSHDAMSNTLSAYHIFEEFRSREFPLVIPKVFAITCWNPEDGDDNTDYQSTLEVIAPGEKPKTFPVNFTAERNKRNRVIHGLQGFVVNAPGDLIFNISLNGKHQASHTISVYNVLVSGIN